MALLSAWHCGIAWYFSNSACNAAAPQEPEKRKQECGAGEPGSQAMGPFPPIDRLEIGERHGAVERVALRDRMVFLELRLQRGRATGTRETEAGMRRRRAGQPGDGPIPTN